MRLILLRHGECLGNVDKTAYTTIPDHALPLTPHGEQQARGAGPRVRELIGDEPFGVCVSPYRRTLHTLAQLGVEPAWKLQEPRLREQDWGNLQNAEEQARQETERNAYGHFFYRLAHGESGADVDDRIAAFLTDLRRPRVDLCLRSSHPCSCLHTLCNGCGEGARGAKAAGWGARWREHGGVIAANRA